MLLRYMKQYGRMFCGEGLSSLHSLLIIGDNADETVFDRALAEELHFLDIYKRKLDII